MQEDEITSDAICGTNRQYAPIFSTDDELTLSFYNMKEEVRIKIFEFFPGNFDCGRFLIGSFRSPNAIYHDIAGRMKA